MRSPKRKLAALVGSISSLTQAKEEEKFNIKNAFNIERILTWLAKNWKLGILEPVILLCLAALLAHTAVVRGSYYIAFVLYLIGGFIVQHWVGEVFDEEYQYILRWPAEDGSGDIPLLKIDINNLSDEQLRTARIEEGKEIGNRIFTLVDKMREDEPLNPKRIYVCEANAYNHLGDLAILEGKANAKEVSLEYYKKAQEHLKILEERTPEEFNMTATEPATESSIPLLAKTAETKRCEVSSSSSTNKKANNGKIACYRESYNLYVKELGQENLETIKTGQQLALALSDSNHKMEAEILLRELIAVSKRVHGAAHRSTEQSESLLRFIKEKKGSMKVGRKNKVRARAA